MAAVKEMTIEEKLNKLFELQQIYSQLDEFTILKGELPMEVKDLEDELEGLHLRIDKLEKEINKADEQVSGNKIKVKECEDLINRYESQQNNVKNNREYEALSKEIQLQRLEIQLIAKREKEMLEQIEQKKVYFEESKGLIEGKEKALKDKKKELEKILIATEKEEKKLAKKIAIVEKQIEERLLNAFYRIRKAYKNGLAVVAYERNSCGGCHASIPPQRQLEIRQQKKIIVCEHCGRIMVDAVTMA